MEQHISINSVIASLRPGRLHGYGRVSVDEPFLPAENNFSAREFERPRPTALSDDMEEASYLSPRRNIATPLDPDAMAARVSMMETFFLLHPHDLMVMAWNAAVLVLLIIPAFFAPYAIGFAPNEYWAISTLINAVFVVDTLLQNFLQVSAIFDSIPATKHHPT